MLRTEISLITNFLEIIYSKNGSSKLNKLYYINYDKYYVIKGGLLSNLTKREFLLREIKYKPSLILYEEAMGYFLKILFNDLIIYGKIF